MADSISTKAEHFTNYTMLVNPMFVHHHDCAKYFNTNNLDTKITFYSGTSRTGAQPVARKSAPVRESAPIREGNMLGTEPNVCIKISGQLPHYAGAPVLEVPL